MANIPFLNNAYFAAKVGIGTDSPSAKLHIEGDGSIIRLQINSDVNGTFIDFRDSTGTRTGYVGTTGASDDMFLFTQASKPIRFFTNATERARITGAGNVGIGTTSPDAKLDIEGDFEAAYALKFTNTKGTGNVSGFRSHGLNGQDLSLYNGANRIQRWDENGNSFFDGNVGIGTTSPSAKLHIVDTDGANIILNSNTGAENNGIWMTEGGGATPYVNGAYFHYDSTNNLVRLNTGTTTLSTRFVVQRDTGKFIVGGATANQTQSVMSSRQNGSSIEFGHLNQSGQYYGTLGAMSSSGSPFIAFSADNSVSNSFTTRGAKGFVISQDTSISGDLMFSSVPLVNTANQGLVERMRITSAGNVGIGTTSPNAKLHIGPDSLVSGYTPDRSTLAISDTTNGGQLIIRGQSPRIWFDGTAGGNAELFLDGSKLNILSGNPTSTGPSRLYIKADGNVGIGTTSPSTKLYINGVTTSFGFRTATTNTEFNLISRNSAGNSPLYVQSANSGTNQWIARFNYGSATANAGQNVLTVAKDNSYFVNTNVGIGTTTPTQKLHVAGNARVTGAYYDSANSPGTGGQVLTSTATGTDWIDPTLLPAESAEKVIQTVRLGEAVSKGDPLVITGYHGSTGPAIVERADANKQHLYASLWCSS